MHDVGLCINMGPVLKLDPERRGFQPFQGDLADVNATEGARSTYASSQFSPGQLCPIGLGMTMFVVWGDKEQISRI